jgi:hypothetical protein
MSPRRRPAHRPDQRQDHPTAAAAAAARGPQANPAAIAAAGPTQLELFCPVCCGLGVIAAEALDRPASPTSAPDVCSLC